MRLPSSAVLPLLPDSVTFKRVLVALVAIPVVVFGLGVAQNDFVEWDDPSLIQENPIVQSLSPSTVAKAFSSYDPELYIPLTFLSYQFDHLVGGLSPVIYHLHNLVLHTLNVLLVAWVVLLFTKDRRAALISALLFAVHPLQVETVMWASARKDLLSSFWFLIALGSALERRAGGKRGWEILSVVAFGLALLAKVMVITLPALLLLVDWRDHRLNLKSVLRLWPYAILALIFAFVAAAGKEQFLSAVTIHETVVVAFKSVSLYLRQFVMPHGLSVLYPYTGVITFASMDVIVAAVVIVLFLALGVVFAKNNRTLLFGWLFFLIALSPTLLLYRKGEHLTDIYIASDRYFYLPGLGLILLVALLGSWLWKKNDRLIPLGIAVLIAVLSIYSFFQSRLWKDTDTLFLHVLYYYPNSHVAQLDAGNMELRRGNFEKALEYYSVSLQLQETSLGYYNLGKAMMLQKKYDSAILANLEALKIDPNLAIALTNLGAAYVEKGDFLQAEPALKRAYEIKPTAEATFNLGAVYEKLERYQEAIALYEKSIELAPPMLPALKRLMALAEASGNAEAAKAYAAQILRFEPDNAEALRITK